MAEGQTARPGRLDLTRFIDLPSHPDGRGVLTAIEGARDIGFEIQRVYLLHDIVAERGGHAHRDTHQVIIAASGGFTLVLSDGTDEARFRVDSPARGVAFGPMLFIRMTDFMPGTCAVVLASTHYDCSRSIRSWEEYLAVIAP